MDYFIKNDGIPSVREHVAHTQYPLEAQSSGGTTELIHANNSMHEMVTAPSNTVRSISDGVSNQADISAFLTRKVKIATKVWSVGSPFVQILQPWHLFLDNAAVKRKLENYQLIKGNLKITILINGTPFHKGMLLASYLYLDAANEVITVGGDTQLVTRSQRPHIFLNASTSKSGCICVPFFLPTNYLSLTDPLFDSSSIGRLNIDSFDDLAQINSGTDSVTVTVFAEMMDVKLTSPTMNLVALSGVSNEIFDNFLVAQAGDEYPDNGVISGPASTIASIAGMLTKAPVIGPLALATQIGASAVGKIAKLFGFSKPNQLADIMPMRNYPVSSLALCEGADTSLKLTVTGKAELCIDPATVDLPSDDDLLLANITSRESYITQFSWPVTASVDDVIFAMDVDPMVERRELSLDDYYRIVPTALSFASRPFSAWSGTLKYRFQVIGSQFHRGRLAIVYDPKGPFVSNPFNTTFNTILDLAEARDFTVSFGWQQDRPYMFTSTDNSRVFFQTVDAASKVSEPSTCNGIFYITVVNELVVPDATTPVEVLISVSAGDDYELVNPSGLPMKVYPYTPAAQSMLSSEDFSAFNRDSLLEAQSSVEEVPTTENSPEQAAMVIDITQGVETHPEEKPIIFFGEKVTSFRQLLKRYSYYRMLKSSGGNPYQLNYNYRLSAMPLESGFDPAGLDVTIDGAPYNYVGTNYISYVKRAFAGWRGALRWKFVPLTDNKSLSVTRLTGPENRGLEIKFEAVSYRSHNPAFTAGAENYNRLTSAAESTAGTALTQCRSMDALEVEIPYTIPLRFSKTRGTFTATGTNILANACPGGDRFQFTATTANQDPVSLVDTYVAAGEDFTLFGWIGAPVVYASIILPPAP